MIEKSQINALIDLLGKDTINDIRLQYVEDSTQKIAKLKSAWDEEDYQTLQEISHSLKSSSLNMAMRAFAQQCEKIEQSASQQSDNGIQDILDSLSTIHSESLAALETYFLK